MKTVILRVLVLEVTGNAVANLRDKKQIRSAVSSKWKSPMKIFPVPSTTNPALPISTVRQARN